MTITADSLDVFALTRLVEFLETHSGTTDAHETHVTIEYPGYAESWRVTPETRAEVEGMVNKCLCS